MRCDLAQEQFSEYIEETLTPSTRHILQQHIAECDPCSAQVAQLREVFALLGEGMPMVETPPGFRANVLNAIREQPAPMSLWQRIRGVFAPTQGGRASLPAWGTAAAACVVVLVGGVWLNRHAAPISDPPPINSASLAPWGIVPVDVQNNTGILQGVRSYHSADGKNYHVFGLHLPTGMSTTSYSVNVLQGADALSDASLLGDADKAPTAWSGTIEPNTSVQVPVALTADVPDDTSMMTLVSWSDSMGAHKELCIVPVSKASNTQSVFVGEPMYQALETIAVQYQQPVIINDDAVNLMNTPVTQAPAATDTSINAALADTVIPDQLTFAQQKDGAYVIDAG